MGCASTQPTAPQTANECPKAASSLAATSKPALLRLDLEAEDPTWSGRGDQRVTDQAHRGVQRAREPRLHGPGSRGGGEPDVGHRPGRARRQGRILGSQSPHPDVKNLVPSSGSYLEESLGKQYVSIGFAFGEGSFQAVHYTGQARGLTRFSVGPPPVGSIGEALSRTGWPLLFVDLRKRPTAGPVASWFEVSHPMREIGAVFRSDQAMREEVKLRERFDAALFVRTTTRARPLLRKRPHQK